MKTIVHHIAALTLFMHVVIPAPAASQEAIHLSLRQTAEIAASKNPLVHAAHRDVEAAEKHLSTSWRQYLPTITANALGARVSDEVLVNVAPMTLPLAGHAVSVSVPSLHMLDRSFALVGMTAVVPVFTGLRIESGIRASKHLLAEATAQDTLALQKQVGDALLEYEQCLLALQVVAAREEADAMARRHNRDVEFLQLQGIATQYDLTRANLAVNEAGRALEEATHQRDLAFRLLKKSLDLPDSTAIVLTDSLQLVEQHVDLNNALVEADNARPELTALKEKQEALRAAAAAELGKMLPQIGIVAGYKLLDSGIPQVDVPRWTVGLSGSLTIFDGLRDHASAQMLEIQESKIDEVRHEAHNAIALEVRKYYYDMRTALRTITATATAEALAAESFRMASRRFETGVGTSLEVVDAQTSVAAARTAHAAALSTYRSSAIRLVRALGRTETLLKGVF